MPIFKTSAKAIKIKADKKLEQALKDLGGIEVRLVISSFRAKWYRFIFAGIQYRHYEILQKRVDILEKENDLQKQYIKVLEEKCFARRGKGCD